jgi:hypothetical protein
LLVKKEATEMAYITTEEVRAIRNELKNRFPTMKFSVRKDDGLAVTVSILSGDCDFSDIELRNFITGDIVNFSGYMQVNHHHLANYGDHQHLLGEILDVIKTAPANAEGGRAWYNNSDAMVDYFDTAFYIHMEIGRRNRPYKFVESKKRAA